MLLIPCRKLGYGGEKEKELPSTSEVVLVQALGGVIAGASSAIATTPMDTVKTRLQVCVKEDFLYYMIFSWARTVLACMLVYGDVLLTAVFNNLIIWCLRV